MKVELGVLDKSDTRKIEFELEKTGDEILVWAHEAGQRRWKAARITVVKAATADYAVLRAYKFDGSFVDTTIR